MAFANEASRSECNLDDLDLTLKKHRVNLQELEEYLNTVEPVPFPIKVPKFPAVIRPVNRIQRGCLDISEDMLKEIALGHLDSNPSHGENRIPDLNMAKEMIDTVIGYAYSSPSDTEADSEDIDDDHDVDLSDDIGSGDHLERINMNSATGGFTIDTNGINNRSKKKEPIPMKRSEYYEPWMPPLVPIILSESETKRKLNESLYNLSINTSDEAGTDAGHSGGQQMSPNKDPKTQYEIATVESSAQLTAVYLNKDGQIISLTGKEGRAPDPRMPPPDSDEEPSEDEDNVNETLNQSDAMKSSENGPSSNVKQVDSKESHREGKIPKFKLRTKEKQTKEGKMKDKKEKGIKINIGKHKVSKAKDNLEKLQKMRKNKDKIKSSLKSGHFDHEKQPKLKLLSIKVSGLKSGTPTASPKVPDGFSWSKDGLSPSSLALAGHSAEEIDPETEERIDSTIDDVLAGVAAAKGSKVTDKDLLKKIRGRKPKDGSKIKVPKVPKEKVKEAKKKKPTSKDLIEDSESDDGIGDSVFKFKEEDVTPRKSPLKKTPSPTRKSHSPVRVHHSPSSAHASSSGLGSPSKAAKKLYPPEISVDARFESPERSDHKRTPEAKPMIGDLRTEAQRKKGDDEFDAAKILVSMSTTPTGSASSNVGSLGTDSALTSPFDTSAFNLGKQLASLNPAAAAAAAAAASSGSLLHPFAPPPPPPKPFKVCLMLSSLICYHFICSADTGRKESVH